MVLLIIFLLKDRFEYTVDDAMNSVLQKKKIHIYTKFGISGK